MCRHRMPASWVPVHPGLIAAAAACGSVCFPGVHMITLSYGKIRYDQIIMPIVHVISFA